MTAREYIRGAAPLVAALWVLLAFAAIVERVHQPEIRGTAHHLECDWWQELADTLNDLGESPETWRVMPGEWMGATWGADEAAINPDVPCRAVSWVIAHEWVHLQQSRLHGPEGAWERYGPEGVEHLADCGAWVMGYRPTDHAHPVYHDACSPEDLWEALSLVSYRPDEVMTTGGTPR